MIEHDNSPALALLEKVIVAETDEFERRIQGKPFLPHPDLQVSSGIFNKHCQQLNSFFGRDTLRHFCFMRIPMATPNRIYVLEWRKSTKAEPHEHHTNEELLYPKIVPLIEHSLYHHPKVVGTPQRILGLKAVSYYLVLARTGPAARATIREPIAHCGVVFPKKDDSSILTQAIDELTRDRVIQFEAYHVIAGIEPEAHARLAHDATAQKALKLASMQFQREWGSGELNELTEKRIADARLHTFDEVLHSALNALRSIQSEAACMSFAIGNPPRRLRYRLVGPSSDRDASAVPDQYAETLLLETLRRLLRGERATAAALSLGRLLAHRKLLENMRSKGVASLKQIVESAVQMVRDLDQGTKTPAIECDWHNLERAQIRVGYLRSDLLVSLVFELLLNAYNHAKTPINIRVTSDIHPQAHQLCLRIISGADPATEWETVGAVAVARYTGSRTRRESFLIRFARVEEALAGGLGIKSSVVQEGPHAWYHAQLWMRALELHTGEKAFPV